MAIMRFDPMRGFEQLSRRFGSLMSDLDKGFSVEYGNFAPRVDISEDERHFFIEAELPGIKKEDVKVSINDENVLTIKGVKERKIEEKSEAEDNSRTYIRSERVYGEFTRSFLLPENVSKGNIQAKYDNGTLNLTLDKVEPEKPKEISIDIA